MPSNHPWNQSYQPIKISAPQITGNAITGALSADWTIVQGQTPRDVAIPTGTNGVGIDAGCAFGPGSELVSPWIRYDPSIGTRNVFFRASAMLKCGGRDSFGDNAGAAVLMIFAGSSPVIQVGLLAARVVAPIYGSALLVNYEGAATSIPITIDSRKWYNMGVERTLAGLTFYWNSTPYLHWTDAPGDEQMDPFYTINSNAMAERQKDPFSASLYIGGDPSSNYAFLGGSPDYSGYARPYFAETQLIFPVGTRPPGLPQYPINLPSGGDLALPNMGFTPIDFSLASYHRYKNVRAAMQTYNNVRLDQ
jgi:hypothetical protein